jgi:hypothetical protein
MVDEKLYDEIAEYCRLNGMDDVDAELNRMLRVGFNVERFGTAPVRRHMEPQPSAKEDVQSDRHPLPTLVDDKPKPETEKKLMPKKVRIIQTKRDD